MEQNQQKDPLGDGLSSVTLVDFMGNDLSIVNDARVSYDKESSKLTNKDEKLIKYLITHQHTSPFRGTVFKFKVKAPLYIGRQWFKHAISSTHCEEQNQWNEKSFRFVEVWDKNEFYVPSEFRGQSKSNKQSGDFALSDYEQNLAKSIYKTAVEESFEAYSALLATGVCREQARAVLAPAVYTTWIWTTSLQALLHFIRLRKGSGAQHEITKYAIAIEELISDIVPVTMHLFEANKALF